MKRIWIILMAAMLLTAGCAKALPADAFAQKNTERIVEIASVGMEPPAAGVSVQQAAEPSAPAGPLYAKLGAPARYTVDLALDTDKLSITVDAAVMLPDAAGMPTVRVSARDFTQDEVTRLFKALCGDAVMYKVRTQSTRAEIQEQIRHFEEELKTATGARREKVEQNIAYYERELAAAPETVADEVCDGTMSEKQLGVQEYLGKYMAVSAREHAAGDHEGKSFWVQNNTYAHNTKSEYDFPIGATLYYSSHVRRLQLAGLHPYVLILDESAVPAAAAGELTRTPAGARQLVEAFWAASGFPDMGVSGVWLGHNSGNAHNRLEDDPYGEKHFYVVACAQRVNGVVPRSVGTHCDGWSYESCIFLVTDAGIERLVWGSPYAYEAVVTNDTQMLPFEKIDEIFRKMMSVKYARRADNNPNAKLYTYHVDRAALELQRVQEQGSDDTGLLIPVWNFYGSYHFSYISDESGHGSDDAQVFPKALLTINAIDGSIIDERQGY